MTNKCPCLYEIDRESGEATGQVLGFCSLACREDYARNNIPPEGLDKEVYFTTGASESFPPGACCWQCHESLD